MPILLANLIMYICVHSLHPVVLSPLYVMIVTRYFKLAMTTRGDKLLELRPLSMIYVLEKRETATQYW